MYRQPFRQTLPFLNRPFDSPLSSILRHRPRHRLFSSQKPPPPPSSTTASTHPLISRLLSTRNPLLRPLTTRLLSPLISAPVSTITAFLILHELTAFIPLVILTSVFHYTEWLPAYFAEGEWVDQGVRKFTRYFKRKGWIEGDGDEVGAGAQVGDGVTSQGEIRQQNTGGARRLILEVATSYAIIKLFLPVRLAVSVWWAEGFARRVVLPFGRVFGRSGKKVKGSGSPLATTRGGTGDGKS